MKQTTYLATPGGCGDFSGPPPAPANPAPEPPEKLSKNQVPWTVQFEHRGRRYSLYKRHHTRQAPYQICLVRRGQRFRHSLETNDSKTAIDRAKALIDKVLGQKWDEVQSLKTRRRESSTIKDVFDLYPKVAQVSKISLRNNIGSMRWLLECTTGQALDPVRFPLSQLSGSLISDFQRRMVENYQAKAAADEPAQREARERALRSSRSVIKQARSLFAARSGLLDRYREHGITVPANVTEFMSARLEGRITKTEYHAPPDSIVQQTFREIEKLRDTDRAVFVAFWLAAGAGLRRGEIRQMRWEYLIQRDGRTWVSGGIGKDGERIEVPVQTKAIEALAGLRRSEGHCLGETGLEFARRLNFWLRTQGWRTQKAMHELRSYIGSLIYRADPVAAMRFLRHKSIRQTEQFYVRYGRGSLPPDVL